MGPVRGFKKRKRGKTNVAASASTAAGQGGDDWWVDFSRRITGASLSSFLFCFALVCYGHFLFRGIGGLEWASFSCMSLIAVDGSRSLRLVRLGFSSASGNA